MPNDEKRWLNVPASPPVEFERNYIKTAVCELRFPTLLELETRIPDDFQRALRAEYPFYDRATSATLGLTVNTVQQHQFRSKDQRWTVILKSFALAIETSRYACFKELYDRFERVLKAASKLLDTDFYTRLGLRYINALPVSSATAAEGWVNPDLVGPLVRGLYGEPERFWQEIRGHAPRGQFSFRHGLADPEPGLQGKYLLDFDFYDENGTWKDVLHTLQELHAQSWHLFR